MLDGQSLETSLPTKSPPREIHGQEIQGIIQRTIDTLENNPPDTNKIPSEWFPNINRLKVAFETFSNLSDTDLKEITYDSFIASSFEDFNLTEEDLSCINYQHQFEQTERYKKESLIDSLTELPNRRKFISELEKSTQSVLITEIAKLLHITDKRNKPASGIITAITDLDHFKTFNAGEGKNHVYGDQKLKEFAKLLIDNFRTPNNTGRVGGEEFGVSFEVPALNQKEIEDIIQGIEARRALMSRSLEETVIYKGNKHQAGTLSMGIVYFPGTELIAEFKTLLQNAKLEEQDKELLFEVLNGDYNQDNELSNQKTLEKCVSIIIAESGQEIIKDIAYEVIYKYTDDQEIKAKETRDCSVSKIYQQNIESIPTTPSPTPA